MCGARKRDWRIILLELEPAGEQLLREERLAAVGRFSSAIAHEIRNPVAGPRLLLVDPAEILPGSEAARKLKHGKNPRRR
jgi:C4-dicarboxylate-specific signal transduction histidine kinase